MGLPTQQGDPLPVQDEQFSAKQRKKKVSFHPGCLTLMQQNKVLQLAGQKTSVTKQESQLKTQDARPPLERKGRCSPAVITWRQEVLIKLLLETFTGLKNITFKGSFSLFLPNKKAARSLVQETCPHRHHTRRQGGFFWVNVRRLPLPTPYCSVEEARLKVGGHD